MMEYEHTLVRLPVSTSHLLVGANFSHRAQQSLERSAFRSCRQQIIDVRDIYFCLLDTYNKVCALVRSDEVRSLLNPCPKYRVFYPVLKQELGTDLGFAVVSPL